MRTTSDRSFRYLVANSAHILLLVCAANAFGSQYLYIANQINDNVDVIDAATHSLRDSIIVGPNPVSATLNHSQTRLYVLNRGDNSLVIVNTWDDRIEKTIPLGAPPNSIAIPENDAAVFVALEVNVAAIDTVVTIDTDAGSVVHTLPTNVLEAIATSPDGQTLYTASQACELVAYDVQTYQPIHSHACSDARQIVVSADGASLFLNGPDSIEQYDSATLAPVRAIGTLDIDGGPLALDAGGHRLFLGGNEKIAIIDVDTGSIDSIMPFSCQPSSLALSSDQRSLFGECIFGSAVDFRMAQLNLQTGLVGDLFPIARYAGTASAFVGLPPSNVYVANGASSSIAVLNAAVDAVSDTIGVGSAPAGVVVSSDSRWMYATNAMDDTVSVVSLDTRSVVATIAVGARPAGLAVSPDGSRLYVANSGDDSISVIDVSARTVLTTWPVEPHSRPLSVALTPDGGKVYVTLSDWYYIAVFDTASNSPLAPIYADSGVHDIVMDANGAYAYASSAAGYNVVYRIDVLAGLVVNEWPAFPFWSTGKPQALAVSRDGTRIHVGSQSEPDGTLYASSVSTLNAATGDILNVVALDNVPCALAASPEGRFVYAAIESLDEISIIDVSSNRVIRSVGGVQGPCAMAPIVEPLSNFIFRDGFDPRLPGE